MRRGSNGPPRREAKGRNSNQLLIYSHPIDARRAFYPQRHYYLSQVTTASQGFEMEIIAASTEIMLLVALGFGILSIRDTAANAYTPVRSVLAVLAMRSSCAFDTTVR